MTTCLWNGPARFGQSEGQNLDPNPSNQPAAANTQAGSCLGPWGGPPQDLPEAVDPSHSIQAILSNNLVSPETIHYRNYILSTPLPCWVQNWNLSLDNSTHKMFYIRWAKTQKIDFNFSWLGKLGKKWQISQWWSCSVKHPWILEAVCCSLPSHRAETDLLWKFGVGHSLIIATV